MTPTEAQIETLAKALEQAGDMSDDHMAFAAAILAALPPDWCGHEAPSGTRLVPVATDAPSMFFGRSDAGNRLTFEWNEPDEHGWYTPTITEHRDQPLAEIARLRAALAKEHRAQFAMRHNPGVCETCDLLPDVDLKVERPGEPEGDPDYMCPNCVTPWKCNGPHIPQSALAPEIPDSNSSISQDPLTE